MQTSPAHGTHILPARDAHSAALTSYIYPHLYHYSHLDACPSPAASIPRSAYSPPTDENGLSEASSPVHENVGFMAYNVLAGGVLTGKYLQTPAAVDDKDTASARQSFQKPRGRMDERGWGYTLYRYRSGPAETATRQYAALAKRYGMGMTELAVRWCRDRTSVTTALLGHTSMAQLDESLKFYQAKEPLPRDLAWEIGECLSAPGL